MPPAPSLSPAQNNGLLHRWTFSPSWAQYKQSAMWKKDPLFPRVRKRELHQMFINHNFEIWHKNAYRLSCCVNTERTTKKKSLIISRWGFLSLSLSLSHVGTRGVSKLHKSEICAALSIFFASSGCPPPSQKRKNEEEKHRMEVGYRELGLGGGVGGRVTALDFIIKISSECLPFWAVSSGCESVVERI